MANTLLKHLKAEATSLVRELDSNPVASALFRGTVKSEDYARFLVQTYHYVRWTRSLLLIAVGMLSRERKHNPLGALLIQKAMEEMGHERWALEDLSVLGWPKSRVRRTAPGTAVRAYEAWNRFAIEDCTPFAFLGTAYVLEFLGARRGRATAEKLIAQGRIRRIEEAVSFLRGHGEADVGHLDKLGGALQSHLPAEDQEAVVLSARATRAFYLGLFTELSRHSEPSPTRLRA
jgi:hypothetical protein